MPSWPALVAFVLAIVPFIPAFSAPFVGLDDAAVLLSVDGYRGLGPDNLRWMFTTTHMGHYQPLTWLSYAIDHALWGMNPRGYHATNILIHAVNAALVFLLARRLLGAARPHCPIRTLTVSSLLAAVVWAVHPLRVESVAWVTERRDVLSTLFLLGAALAYLRAVRRGGPGVASIPAYLFAIALLGLSLLSKAWGMTFFVVALTLDVYPLRRVHTAALFSAKGRGILLEKIPFAVLGLLFAALAAYAQKSTGKAVASLESWTIADRALQACYGLVFYLWKTIAPTSLSPMYEKPPHMEPTDPAVALSVIIALGAAGLLVAGRKRAAGVAAVAFTYLVILSPVLGVLQSGPQLVADRYSYVALIGVTIAAAGGFAMLLDRYPSVNRAILAGVAILIPCVLAPLAWRQTTLWQDNDRLLARIIETGNAGPAVMLSYADALANRGQLEQAIPVYQEILERSTQDGRVWTSLGQVQRRLGRFREAEASLLHGMDNNPEPWQPAVELALMYLKEDELNRPEQAIAILRFAIDDVERPGRPPGLTPGGGGRPYLLMAIALDLTGNPQAARPMLEKAAQFPALRDEALRIMRELDVP